MQARITHEWQASARVPPPPPTDPVHLESMNIFTLSVTKPQQVEPALQLLDEVLRRAPCQDLDVPHHNGKGTYRQLKRYVGIDAEFVKVSLTPKQKNSDPFREAHQRRVKEVEEDRSLGRVSMGGIQNGATEELVSVLTIAVDRHFVISFFLLHMMQHPEAGTVEAVSIWRSSDRSTAC